MCNLFFGKHKNLGRSNDAKRSKMGNSLRGQKNTPHPRTNVDLGQTSYWSKLIEAYLPVARLTILDRLVPCILTSYMHQVELFLLIFL